MICIWLLSLNTNHSQLIKIVSIPKDQRHSRMIGGWIQFCPCRGLSRDAREITSKLHVQDNCSFHSHIYSHCHSLAPLSIISQSHSLLLSCLSHYVPLNSTIITLISCLFYVGHTNIDYIKVKNCSHPQFNQGIAAD